MRRSSLPEIAVGGWAVAFWITALSIQAPYWGQRWFAGLTAWPYNPGWQWEIACFDLALGLLMVLIIRSGLSQRALPILLVLGTLLGVNHLRAALSEGRPGNWIGAVANALGLLLVLAALAAKRRAT